MKRGEASMRNFEVYDWMQQLSGAARECRELPFIRRLFAKETAVSLKLVDETTNQMTFAKCSIIPKSEQYIPYRGDKRIVEAFREEWQSFLSSIAGHPSLANQMKRCNDWIEKQLNDFLNVSGFDTDYDDAVKKLTKHFIKIIESFGRGWEDDIEVYANAVHILQSFLARIGIYTLEIKVGEKMNPKLMDRPIHTEPCNQPQLHETVKEVLHHAYVYGVDGSKIVKAAIHAWRNE